MRKAGGKKSTREGHEQTGPAVPSSPTFNFRTEATRVTAMVLMRRTAFCLFGACTAFWACGRRWLLVYSSLVLFYLCLVSWSSTPYFSS